jgi:hypothetical protein
VAFASTVIARNHTTRVAPFSAVQTRLARPFGDNYRPLRVYRLLRRHHVIVFLFVCAFVAFIFFVFFVHFMSAASLGVTLGMSPQMPLAY